jgi:transposase
LYNAFMSTPAEELLEVRAAYRRVCGQLAERDQEAHDLRQQNEELQGKVDALQSRLERMTRRVYGWSSERHHPGQQRIDLGLPEILVETPASDAAATTTAALVPAAMSTSPSSATTTDGAAAPQRRPRQPGSHPGRRRLPASSEVVEQDLTMPEDERLDEHGQPLPFLGWRTSDTWDYRPGIYLIRRFRLAIYGRPFSVAQDRIVADMPAMLIPRGAMTDAAIIHTVVEKFADHLPLYRQEARAGRCGFPLSRATLVNHVAVVAGAMAPIVAALGDQVRQSPYIHLDDTLVRMLDPGRGHTATTRIWVYRSPAATVFRFSATREGRHPADFLADYRGHIVADGYAGHERLYGLEKATHVACWAHARRKFSEIKERYPLALALVEDIQRLYAIEEATRMASDVDRHRTRHERSGPILERIEVRLTAAVAGRLPAADLGQAIDYTRKRWRQLTRFLDHGWLPIDNNPAENALRPWAVGRKNWLFFGSEAGGERAAIIATVIENCRTQDLDPYCYLCDTVAALHTGTKDYAALTPQAVAAQRDARAA